MADLALREEQAQERCRFLDGWFTQAFASGERPEYGYPKNRLPETTLESMEVVTGFLAKPKT